MPKFKFLALWGLLALYVQACFFDSENTSPSISLPSGIKPVYEGGLFKVIGSIPDGASPEQIVWRTGSAVVHHHGYSYNSDGLVRYDTAYLEWKALPKPIFDTIPAKDSTAKPSYDTSFVDTIGFSENGIESSTMTITLKNFLPNIDSVLVNGVYQYMETEVLNLPAHRGEILNFTLKFTDRFNTLYKANVEFEQQTRIQKISQNDSGIVFQWQSPDSLLEDTITLRLTDSRGLGVKNFRVHRFTYNESGTVWLGSGNRFYKISDLGQIIYTSPATYGEISDIAVHPTRSEVWIADAGKQKVSRLDREGMFRKSDSGFVQPSTLAVDVVSNLLQVGDQDATVKGRIRSYDVSNSDSSKLFAIIDQGLTGPIGSISIDQYDATLTWYTVPEMDMVFKVRGAKKDTLRLRSAADTSIAVKINRPTYISYDARSSKVWISDSTSLIIADTNGLVTARIFGFEFIGGIASTKGKACVIDSRLNKTFLFNATASGLSLNASSLGSVVSGFAKPIAVDISYADASCWVADRDAGAIVHIDPTGSVIRRVSGFKLPSVIRIHKGVE